MKNYFLMAITGVLFFLYSCNSTNLKDSSITHIEVYKTPFGITGPLHYTEKEARTWKPYRIDKREDLEKIKELLILLVDSGRNKFDYINVYMTCDIYLSDGTKKVLYYNKFRIKFDGEIYENSPALIEKLRNLPSKD